jgi:hypothetical protein
MVLKFCDTFNVKYILFGILQIRFLWFLGPFLDL